MIARKQRFRSFQRQAPTDILTYFKKHDKELYDIFLSHVELKNKIQKPNTTFLYPDKKTITQWASNKDPQEIDKNIMSGYHKNTASWVRLSGVTRQVRYSKITGKKENVITLSPNIHLAGCIHKWGSKKQAIWRIFRTETKTKSSKCADALLNSVESDTITDLLNTETFV